MSTPDYSATTIEAAQANTLASIKLQVANLNTQRKSLYLTAFNNWAINVSAGRAPNSDPPKPPPAYVVGYFNDPTSGPGSLGPYGDTIIQWAYPAIGRQPVCEMPPVPQLPSTEKKPHILRWIFGDWFAAGQDDNTPVGTAIPGTSDDGIHGLFLKVPSPVGNGWFQKIG